MSSQYDPVVVAISTALTAVLWAWMWLFIISKIGYRGLYRKLWLVGMCLPPILPAVMIALLLLPWPIYRELKRLRKAIPEIKSKLGRIEKLPPTG
jgi:hypothetical protein